LSEQVASRELVDIGGGDAQSVYLSARAVAQLEREVLAALDAAGGQISREELRKRLPAALSARGFDALIAAMAAAKTLVAASDRVQKPSAAEAARAGLSPSEEALLRCFAAWGKEPPMAKNLAQEAKLAEPVAKAALDKLVARKLVTKVKSDLFMDAGVVAALRDQLLAYLDAHGQIDAGAFKDLTGTSRKFSIPLAEYFDAEKVTLRIGDLRKRRK
jgi:selenocysteine-specific elongation factor